MQESPGWNHNVQYQPVLLDSIPRGAQRALDVGCGVGQFCRALRDRVPHVVGIDRHEASIERARAQRQADSPPYSEYLVADFWTHPFQSQSFDVVVAIAMVHHMDLRTALERMAALLRPGGMLGVIGLATSRRPKDLGFDVAAVPVNLVHK